MHLGIEYLKQIRRHGFKSHLTIFQDQTLDLLNSVVVKLVTKPKVLFTQYDWFNLEQAIQFRWSSLIQKKKKKHIMGIQLQPKCFHLFNITLHTISGYFDVHHPFLFFLTSLNLIQIYFIQFQCHLLYSQTHFICHSPQYPSNKVFYLFPILVHNIGVKW